jgi:hypothetical protein
MLASREMNLWMAQRMKVLGLNVLAAAGAMILGLAAVAPANAYTVKGMGKCSGWVGGTDDRFWILGFISGANYGTSGDTAKNIDANDIYRFVTRYCKEHPDDDLADATTAFIKTN